MWDGEREFLCYRSPMSKSPETKTALIIDANALIHRAWHALPPLTAPDGRIVNAVYGFASILMKVLAAERPTYLVVCWDTPEPTYRHTANKEYKAQRVEQPDEFYAQFPWVKEVVEVYGGTNVELPGYEADDLLATFAERFTQMGVQTTLLTSDKDVWQLIGPMVRVMSFKKGVSETMILDTQALKELTGLTPAQIIDYKAFRGDPSDNLKGVTGIGEKGATELLLAYKDLEGIFKAAHDPKSEISPAVRQKLVAGEQAARDTRHLVRLVKDAPVKIAAEDTKRRMVDEDELRRVFGSFGFKTLLVRAMGGKAKVRSSVPTIPSETPTSPKKKAPSRTAKQTKNASLEECLVAAQTEGWLIVHQIQEQQPSLFGATSLLALGSAACTTILSTDDLKKTATVQSLGRVLSDPATKKMGHGLKGAWHWAKAQGFELKGLDFDTEIAAYLLAAGEGGYDLASLATARLGLTPPEADDLPAFEVDAIRSLVPLLSAELKAQKLDQVMERFEKPLIPVLAQMENKGILIDREYFKGLMEDFRKEKARLEKEMETLAGEPFNPGSPQQLGRILFEVLGISPKGIKRGKTGLSTAASELEKLEGLHPIVEKIGQYREVAKLLSTYVEALPAAADAEGRVHTTYSQALAATGRLSSSNPNLQNIPIRTELGRKIRRGFKASNGFCLLSCDYSQIELRVIAALSKDPKMVEAFQQGLDIHTATAAAISGVPLADVSRDQRRAAKAINFGIIYGQGPHALSKGAGISYEEAKQFIAEYFRVYSGVREYLDQTRALAHAQGYVETLFGRRRPIPDINSPFPQLQAGAERMAINMPVQGTAADFMKLAMIQIAERLPKISKDARLLLQVHDELVFEVPENDVEDIAAKVVDVMQNVEKLGVPIVVDAKYGKNWDELKKL